MFSINVSTVSIKHIDFTLYEYKWYLYVKDVVTNLIERLFNKSFESKNM
jgi:hypothetical protein